MFSTKRINFSRSLNGKTDQKTTKTAQVVCSMVKRFLQEVMSVSDINSLHLGRKYAWIIVRKHHVPRS